MYETNIAVDYTTKDYEGFLQFMKDLIPTLLPEWTDNTESDFGIVLLQLAAYGLHVLSFYQDKGINDNFLETAKSREAIIKLCRFLGYELTIQNPSSVILTFTKYADEISTEVTIPAGTKITTDPTLGDVLFFETDEDLVIASGDLYDDVTATQGYTYPDEIIGIGYGSNNQSITITKEDILINDMDIYTIEAGIIKSWTKVDDFLDSSASDRHYTVIIEGNYYAKITFGNGTNGMKIPTASPIYNTYRIGGGIAGNLGINKLVYLYDDISQIESVTNLSVASGGVDFENINIAKVRAPKLYKTMGRAVTASDFCALAESVVGVEKATLVESFNASGGVYLYIVPNDFGVPSSELVDTVTETIEEIMALNCNLYVYPTTYVEYNVDLTIEVLPTQSNAAKQTEIYDYILEVLNPLYYEHGEDIPDSYILGQVFKIAGVRSASISAYLTGAIPTGELTCAATEFLLLDTLTVTVTGGI